MMMIMMMMMNEVMSVSRDINSVRKTGYSTRQASRRLGSTVVGQQALTSGRFV